MYNKHRSLEWCVQGIYMGDSPDRHNTLSINVFTILIVDVYVFGEKDTIVE